MTLGVAFGATLLLTQDVLAQYKEDRAITDEKQISALRRDVARAVRSTNTPDKQAQDAIVRYYRGVIINGLTNSSAWKNADQLPAWRRTVVGDIDNCRNSSTRKFIHDLVYRFAGRIVVNNETPSYHPVAKYNALLLIGALDERPAQGGSSARKPAVPSRRVRGLLLKYATEPVESLRVGAMIGLGRHAKLMAAAGDKPDASIMKVFANVLSSKEPPEGISVDGHRWMQRIALEGLGDIGDPRAEKMILALMNDGEMPLYVRCTAADALGRLQYGGQRKPDVKAVVGGLGSVALDSLREQITYLKTQIDQQLDPRRNTRPGAEVEELPEVTRVRRQLKFQLGCVNEALDGLANSIQSNATTALSSQIDTLLKSLDEENMDPQSLYDKLIQPGVAIESAIKS